MNTQLIALAGNDLAVEQIVEQPQQNLLTCWLQVVRGSQWQNQATFSDAW